MRCTRCGHLAGESDKFCAECGLFLRDAHVDQRLLLAMEHEREGRHREARRELERLLDNEPDHVLGNHLLGTMYFHQGTLDLAIERYQKAIAGAPRFVLCSYDLGVAWYHRGNMPEAIRAFRRCLEIDPHYNAAHYRLAISLFHAGELEPALEHFERSNALTPEYLMARYHIGVIHERRKELEAAEQEFRKSVDGGVGEVSSLFHLAQIRRSQGNDAEADELLARAERFGKATR
jgi:tetratricopeptide (TPR) repeat protein